MRISDWSSDVCSSDLTPGGGLVAACESVVGRRFAEAIGAGAGVGGDLLAAGERRQAVIGRDRVGGCVAATGRARPDDVVRAVVLAEGGDVERLVEARILDLADRKSVV